MTLPVFTTSQDIEHAEEAMYDGLRDRINRFMADNPEYGTPETLAYQIGVGVTTFRRWLNGDLAAYTMPLRALYKLHLLGVVAPEMQYHYQAGPVDLPERPERASYPEVETIRTGPNAVLVRVTFENDLGDPVTLTMTSACVRTLGRIVDETP